ncbi:MAG: 4-alpha-glucanotransferase [Bacteroidota bacterium]
MKLHFQIHFHTSWGQQMGIVGSLPELGNNNLAYVQTLTYLSDGKWEFVLELPATKAHSFSYQYVILHEGGHIEEESKPARQFSCKARSGQHIYLKDTWRSAGEPDQVFHTSAFRRALMNREPANGLLPRLSSTKAKIAHTFRLYCTRVPQGAVVAICGSDPAIGEWDVKNAVKLEGKAYPIWHTSVVLEHPEQALTYKYVLLNDESDEVLDWEFGDNRFVEPLPLSRQKRQILVNDEYFRYPNTWRGTGVAIPVFSLRSENSLGVGEFTDLNLLTDWAVASGVKMIQILPINDTVATHTWLDSYPYSGISVFALHPMFANLEAIGTLSSEITQGVVQERQRILNSLESMDYDAVMKVKSRFFRLIYEEQKAEFFKEPDAVAWMEEQNEWLQPYAAFSFLRDLYGTPDFKNWGRFSVCSPEILEEICDPTAEQFDDVAIHYFIQYHLAKQLKEATAYARSKGVILKGDIPIGIFRHSVDAWVAPELYNMQSQAGAPPDAFAVVGQNWKFPTYNWQEMAKDGFQWWKRRLIQLSDYFDAFRIDHILGFFRIWEIPTDHVQGLMGHFNPALPVSLDEFASWDIHFDYERFCRPYIRRHMLWDRFGELTDHVIETYLEEYAPGCFRMKPEYDTQAKVEAHLSIEDWMSREEIARRQQLQDGLFSLIAEVLFLEAPFTDGTAFNPRISIHHTASFQELDDYTRHKLNELYNHYYYERHEEFWRNEAMGKLPAITRATDMIVCGEDLGMVPDTVPPTMRELGLLSLEIQRMPKDPQRAFAHPNDAPYFSVVSTSSHDMSPVRAWWEEDRGVIQHFFNQELGQHGGAPQYCEAWIAEMIVNQHLYSPAMWAIFPLQDLLAMDDSIRREDPFEEQINVPSNPRNYWRYRMHLTLEELLMRKDFSGKLKQMVEAAGRLGEY